MFKGGLWKLVIAVTAAFGLVGGALPASCVRTVATSSQESDPVFPQDEEERESASKEGDWQRRSSLRLQINSRETVQSLYRPTKHFAFAGRSDSLHPIPTRLVPLRC